MDRPVILFYSLPFPTIWTCALLFFDALFPEQQLKIIGKTLIIIASASLISWLFVRQYRRDFTKSEYYKIIFYCIGWALLFDFTAFYLRLTQAKPAAGLDAREISFFVLITVVIDGLFVWIAFLNFGRRIIREYLARHGQKD